MQYNTSQTNEMYGKSNSTAYIAFLDVFSPFYNANVSFGDVSKINVVFAGCMKTISV